ncbi:MAG: class I SAM-dependent methyltransferase [Candidatus Fervidibacter sp.]|uniref:class I SAM-dependent methyltransferase n=1 Tax=Candidatus Fervidibacter sp. TaxID=3100871 RepID=UPI004049D096
MTDAEILKMARLEDRYWWFIGRRFIVMMLIQRFWKPKSNPALILDLGCGTGGSFSLLRNFGVVVGLDNSRLALSHARKRGMKHLTLGDALSLPFIDNSFDLVAILDVLEHLEDDCQALKEIWRVLKPEGKVVFTVPAFMSLWSVHDIALAHKRRYLWNEIHDRVVQSGLKLLHLSYAICPLLPIVFVFRKIQNSLMRNKKPATALIELPSPLNRLLIALLKLEAALIPLVRLPFGVSLVGIAEKQQEPV